MTSISNPVGSPVQVSFGSWLLERRRAAGITQDELAERIGCAPITLQKIVSGKRRPSRQIALLLAAYFGVPEDEHEAFVTFARASIATPALAPDVSSPTAPSFLTDKPGDLTNPTKENRNNSSQTSPWRAVHLSKSNLPLVLTTLIGREQDLDEVCSRLMQTNVRLLTITGSPGTGKTSLSIALATALLGDFEDGVYLVELAPMNDRAMVIPSIARALGLGETVGQSVEETLLGYVKDKRILLVLDNFEHLLDAGPGVVKLIQASPWLKVLITSREALHVRGERRYPLSPLGLPVLADKPSLEELARSPAVQLFVERAQDVDVDFALTEENAWDVARVCINMSGLPLAIELAAGRVSLFPPRFLVSTLGQQLKVLTGGSRDLPPRQRTLRQAIDWSYDLLDERHRELFRRMAVFWGGHTLQSLEAVCNSASLQVAGKKQKVEVLDGVEALVSSNLLQQREGRDGEPRFWMLETVHEYAREKLEESGEGQALQREHALFFMRWAEEAEPHLKRQDQAKWLQQLDDENDNIRAAFRWALARGEAADFEIAETGLRMAIALERFWRIRGYLREGLEQIIGVLAIGRPIGATRAKALKVAAMLADACGDYPAAYSMLQESLQIVRESGDKDNLVDTLHRLGNVLFAQEDYVNARSVYEECLSLDEEISAKRQSMYSLGLVMYEQGDYASANSIFEETLALEREAGDTRQVALALANLGLVAFEQGDYALALSRHSESLAIRRGLKAKLGIAYNLEGLAMVYRGMDCVEKAARLWGASQAIRESIGAPLPPNEYTRHKRERDIICTQLGEDGFSNGLSAGRAMGMEEAMDYALEQAGDDQ